MQIPDNGTRARCEVCGQPINYFYGWRHDLGENQMHRAWPRRVEYTPSWPVVTEDDQVILLTTGESARLVAW